MSKAVAYERALGRLRVLERGLSANARMAAMGPDAALLAVFEGAAQEATWLVKVFESFGEDVAEAGDLPAFREELAAVLVAHKALKAEALSLTERVASLESAVTQTDEPGRAC